MTVARIARAPPSLGKLGGGVLRLAVDVVECAQLRASGSLSAAARDPDRPKAHFGGELDAEVAESAEAENRDQFTRAGAAIAQRVEGGDPAHMSGAASTGESCSRNRGKCFGAGDHVLAIAAIGKKPGDARHCPAGKKLATAARIAVATVAAIPSDADPLAAGPPGDARSDGIDDTDHFVSRYDWIFHARKTSMNAESVAMADAAGLYLDPDRAGFRFGNVALDDFKRTVGAGNLDDTHFRHISILAYGLKKPWNCWFV